MRYFSVLAKGFRLKGCPNTAAIALALCFLVNGMRLFAAYDIGDVVVTGTKSVYGVEGAPVETSLVTGAEIEISGAQTPADALRLVPGLSISGGALFGAAKRYTTLIQGLPSDYGLVLVDGKRIKSEHIHTGVNTAIIPVEFIEKIEVVKGPVSALYGSDAISGVINIITKRGGKNPGFTTKAGYGSYNTKTAQIGYGGASDALDYFMSAKYTDTDGANSSWFKQLNGMFNGSLDLGGDGSLTLDGRYYRNAYPSSGKEVYDTSTEASLAFENKVPGASVFRADAAFAAFRGGSRGDLNNTYEAGLLRSDVLPLAGNTTFTAGLEAKWEEFERVNTEYHNQQIFGLFIQNETAFGDRILVTGSCRLDYRPSPGPLTAFTPRGAFRVYAADDTIVRLSAGGGFRAPSLMALYEYRFNHKTFYRDGNPDLKPEYSWGINGGVEQFLFERMLSVRITGFRNSIKDMIMNIPTGEVVGTIPVVKRQNTGDAFTTGFEIETRAKLNELFFSAAYTNLDTRDYQGKAVSYNPRHSFLLSAGCDFKEMGFGAEVSVDSAIERYYKLVDGSTGTLKDYVLLNVNVYKELFEFARVFFTVYNALNQTYEMYEEGRAPVNMGTTFTGGLALNFR